LTHPLESQSPAPVGVVVPPLPVLVPVLVPVALSWVAAGDQAPQPRRPVWAVQWPPPLPLQRPRPSWAPLGWVGPLCCPHGTLAMRLRYRHPRPQRLWKRPWGPWQPAAAGRRWCPPGVVTSTPGQQPCLPCLPRPGTPTSCGLGVAARALPWRHPLSLPPCPHRSCWPCSGGPPSTTSAACCWSQLPWVRGPLHGRCPQLWVGQRLHSHLPAAPRSLPLPHP
jgi:hypothetical protein